MTPTTSLFTTTWGPEFLLQSSGYPVGTAEQFPEGPAGIEPMYKTVTSKAITPITETSTVYYYSGGHAQFRRLMATLMDAEAKSGQVA